jgi:gliding motility-associated-like protein
MITMRAKKIERKSSRWILNPSFIFLFMFLTPTFCFSQSGYWTWMVGKKSSAQNAATLAVYGKKGIASPLNTPIPTYEGLSWTDLEGNFWLFNGNSNRSTGVVWKFNPSINQWTWMSGDTTLPNHRQGIVGVPSATANPGDRWFGTPCWTDLQGNFWLFGGRDRLNSLQRDLWKYDPHTLQWTWVRIGGKAEGNYGTMGVPASYNNPPALSECKATWVDNDGNLWMFGGMADNNAEFDSMWKYDIKTNMWTWMSGHTSPTSAIYGTKGIPSPGCTPGSRFSYAHWKDLAGNFWFFGGYFQKENKFYNDLWKYDIITNQWTWISGTNIANDLGHITSICTPSKLDYPSRRTENTACWTDVCGNFWMYGGMDTPSYNVFNDFWVYNPSSDIWTIIKGSPKFQLNMGEDPVYGTIQIPDPANHPGSRGGACTWMDKSGNFWLFGGYQGTNVTNDLWKYTPGPDCPGKNNQVPVISASSTSICKGDSVILSAQGNLSLIWQPGNLTGNSIIVKPSSTTTYTVKGPSVCGGGFDSVVIKVQEPIEVKVIPAFAPICPGDTLSLKATGADSYTWSPAFGLNSSSDSTVIASSGLPMVYTVVGKTGVCKSSAIAEIVIAKTDTLSLFTSFCEGDSSIILYAPQHINGPFQWFNNTTIITGATADSIRVNPNFIKNYHVEWSYNGCIYKSTKINRYPVSLTFDLSTNTFTPNGDGMNDMFFPYVHSPMNVDQLNYYLKDFNLQVLDRWGNSIFSSTDPNIGWDGKTKTGRTVSDGIYYWIASFHTRCNETDNYVNHGTVQLLR